MRYVAFCDAASGERRGNDAFTVAVAHVEQDHAVLDVLRAWLPPFNPSGVIAEIADLLKRYGITSVSGDKYAPGFVAEHFRAHGIGYEPSLVDRSALYLELLPLVNSGQVRLLDQPELLRELRGLERCRGTSRPRSCRSRAGRSRQSGQCVRGGAGLGHADAGRRTSARNGQVGAQRSVLTRTAETGTRHCRKRLLGTIPSDSRCHRCRRQRR